MYKYSDRCVRNMRDLLDMALMGVDSGMASAADRVTETEKQVSELSERLFEAARERGCKSIDFNYLLCSDDGERSRIMSFASDQEAIDFVKSHFEIFGSVRMTGNLAHIYRRTDMDYYLAATVDMAALEVVQRYPVGYWTGVETLTDEQPEEQDNQSETEQDQNQEQTESNSESEDSMYLHVETVYQLARLDIAFNSGLCRMASVLYVDDYPDDPMDCLAHAYGFAQGALLALCFQSVSGRTLSFHDYKKLQNQLLRLHELILERV